MEREQIVYKRVDELKNNPKNPRKNDEAVKSVAKSIEKYGFRNPLIVDENGVVWCGNTRLKASKQLGLEEVPCIIVKDLTEKEMTELALLDNKTNEVADWDFEMLKEILPEVDLDEFELDWGVVEKEEKEKPEVEFTEILGEENNYVVLVFKTDIDWLQAQSLLDIKEVKAYNTSPKENVKICRKGIGRVLDGKKILERLTNENFS